MKKTFYFAVNFAVCTMHLLVNVIFDAHVSPKIWYNRVSWHMRGYDFLNRY